jgi:putative DNA primase/helicase
VTNSSNGHSSIPPKPQALDVLPENIQVELRERKQWLNWKYTYEPERNPDKPWTKPPFQVNGSHAKSNDPNTWTSFERAMSHVGDFDGVGYCPADQDPYTLIDLDHCRDPLTGEIAAWAQRIIDILDSYTEISPTGTGIRIITKGKLPPTGRKKGNVEMYQTGHYLTITGHHLEGTPREIQERQAQIAIVHSEVFGPQGQPPPNSEDNSSQGGASSGLSDREVLDKAFSASNQEKIISLYVFGDTSNYPSESEADMALIGCLAFYTGPDTAQLDRLFRGSKLFRPEKWGKRHFASGETYGEHTIAKVLEDKTEFYHVGGFNDTEPEEPWPEPQPQPGKPVAPTLPGDMIPESYRPWIVDVAQHACFPLEMVAVPVLVGTTTIVGRKLAIRPWGYNDYTIPANLWGAIVARPASMKSHAIDQGLKPLKRLAATAHDRFQADDALKSTEFFAWEAEAKGLKALMEQAVREREKGRKKSKRSSPMRWNK